MFYSLAVSHSVEKLVDSSTATMDGLRCPETDCQEKISVELGFNNRNLSVSVCGHVYRPVGDFSRPSRIRITQKVQ